MKKLGLLLGFWSAGAAAQMFQIYDAGAQLGRYLEETQDLSASFEQTVYQGRSSERSRGEVKMKKPQSFLWHYRQPSVQQVVSDGYKVYFYDQDLAQVTVYAPQDIAGNVAAEVLNSGRDLSQKFQVSLEALPPKGLPGDWSGAEVFQLKPKTSQEYDAIWLILQGGELRALWLEGAQNTAFVLSQVKRNQGLKDELFRFKVPKGVDVIGE